MVDPPCGTVRSPPGSARTSSRIYARGFFYRRRDLDRWVLETHHRPANSFFPSATFLGRVETPHLFFLLHQKNHHTRRRRKYRLSRNYIFPAWHRR